VNIPLAPLVTNDHLAMSANVLVGKQLGPTLMITAAIHGDEINGVEIIRRVLRSRQMLDLRGVLIAIPVVNVHGFLAQTRYLPDGRDLNRMFPGSATGSLASRVANTFETEVLSRADYGLDLHTGARHRSNLPQLRVDLNDESAKNLAISFGVPVLLHSRMRDGSLRESAADRGIPVMVYEAGESLRFDEFSIRVGVRGILRVMRYLGMLRPTKRKRKQSEPFMAHRSTWVRATTSGVMRTLTSLGAKVSKGDAIGIIGDPMGNTETAVYCPEDGIVIGKTNLPLVSEGDAVFHLACYHDLTDNAEQAISDLQETVGSPLVDTILGN
jgi:predicted deacylase